VPRALVLRDSRIVRFLHVGGQRGAAHGESSDSLASCSSALDPAIMQSDTSTRNLTAMGGIAAGPG
jgi:hypothetical protein